MHKTRSKYRDTILHKNRCSSLRWLFQNRTTWPKVGGNGNGIGHKAKSAKTDRVAKET